MNPNLQSIPGVDEWRYTAPAEVEEGRLRSSTPTLNYLSLLFEY
jgi:hypothetical protein